MHRRDSGRHGVPGAAAAGGARRVPRAGRAGAAGGRRVPGAVPPAAGAPLRRAGRVPAAPSLARYVCRIMRHVYCYSVSVHLITC